MPSLQSSCRASKHRTRFNPTCTVCPQPVRSCLCCRHQRRSINHSRTGFWGLMWYVGRESSARGPRIHRSGATWFLILYAIPTREGVIYQNTVVCWDQVYGFYEYDAALRRGEQMVPPQENTEFRRAYRHDYPGSTTLFVDPNSPPDFTIHSLPPPNDGNTSVIVSLKPKMRTSTVP